MHKIPVTVVTGFLGSGKTTLVRHLLKNNQGRRIAVLVNEFGEVGIDGDILRACQVCAEDGSNPNALGPQIIELANGCLCCTVQEEFLPTMQALLARRDDIDGIVVETSGLALPKPLVQAFRWPEIRTQATVDGVITVVDGDALVRGQVVGDLAALEAQRGADESLDHETPIEELFEDQLACADMVLLTKTDLLPETDCRRLQGWLQNQVRGGVKVLPCEQGNIGANIILGFNAAVEENLADRPSHHDQEEDHDHDEAINSVYVELDRQFDPPVLIQGLVDLVKRQEIYRIKGFVAVPQKTMRLVLQGVGDRFDQFYDRPWQRTEPRLTRLVIIGQQLDPDTLRMAIASL
ncbi:MAG: cobalamin biosynthesis protein CobW [Cyanobacteriota bacterium]|jgi:cobalamin biosynthesis protein CobW